jgi:Glyoxalase/Bleomycin resistance protein/Dioxygenase superfamily
MSAITQSPAPSKPFVTDIRQVCLVVDDLDKTLGELAGQFGIGPFKVWHLGARQLFGRKLRGKDVPWTMKLAIAWVGKMQLEVIQPVKGPSILGEYLNTHGGGIHHLLVATGKLRLAQAIERFKAMGCPTEQEGYANLPAQIGPLTVPPIPKFAARQLSTHFAYMRTEPQAGTVLEVSQLPPLMPFRLGMDLAKAEYRVPLPDMPVKSPARAGLVKEIVKVGIVTRHLDERVAWYSRQLGIGPWRISILDTSQLSQATLRGQPATYKLRIAQALAGGTILELVQPLEGTSLHSEWLDRQGEGVHYLGVTTNPPTWPEIRAQFAAANCPIQMEGESQNTPHFAYLDTTPYIKTTLEVSSLTPP